jgi:hypothetical protein
MNLPNAMHYFKSTLCSSTPTIAMKTNTLVPIAAAVLLSAASASAQGFNSGSDGSMGPLNVTVGGTVLQVPPDGKFHFTTITIVQEASLSFIHNALNTPVYLLATGDVNITAGSIDVSGSDAPSATAGGAGGPGGFDGGTAGGAGKGPGGGSPGPAVLSSDGAGHGVYSGPGNIYGAITNNGQVYGSPLLLPLVGGSGGGGVSDGNGGGGGGGGGAILIASNTRIQFQNGSIRAQGASGRNNIGGEINSGSGGAVRLIAPVVTGSGQIFVHSASASGGRVRVDTIDRTGLNLNVLSGNTPLSQAFTIGSYMTSFPPANQKLDIIAAAGTTIPEGTSTPVTVSLPFGSATNRTVTVQARNFSTLVPIEVVLTPNSGLPQKYTAQIDNAAANPATVTVPVAFPINTPVTVQAWVR